MKVLILGGTLFLGRHLVEALVSRGHTVTLFNRGITSPHLYPELETIRGDRENPSDLKKLANREWDAVIDPSGYLPRIVRMGLDQLTGQCRKYVFVSSLSVYATVQDFREGDRVARLSHPDSEDIQKDYGALKAKCEAEVLQAYGERALIVRAGFLVGPFDRIYRTPYWLERIAQGGTVLCPGEAQSPFQFIDVRDCADWIIKSLENSVGGVFNITGPTEPLRWGRFLEEIKVATSSSAKFVWVNDEFLKAQGISAGKIPFWLPQEHSQFMEKDISKALSQGLTFRAVSETISDTWRWLKRDGFSADKTTGVRIDSSWNAAKEAELLMGYADFSVRNLPKT